MTFMIFCFITFIAFTLALVKMILIIFTRARVGSKRHNYISESLPTQKTIREGGEVYFKFYLIFIDSLMNNA